MKIGMRKREIDKILEYLEPHFLMLEWGSGGSTTFFPRYVSRYHSIEHSKEWYHRVYNEIGDNVRLYYVPQNLPRTRPTKREEFVDYVEQVHYIGVPNYNAVFIDGRARIACAKEVIGFINKESVIFLHDCHRGEYKEIFEIFEEIDRAGNLAVLKLKSE